MILTLILLGRLLETLAKHKTSNVLSQMLKLQAEKAILLGKSSAFITQSSWE
jgi:cation transport ATPase